MPEHCLTSTIINCYVSRSCARLPLTSLVLSTIWQWRSPVMKHTRVLACEGNANQEAGDTQAWFQRKLEYRSRTETRSQYSEASNRCTTTKLCHSRRPSCSLRNM